MRATNANFDAKHALDYKHPLYSLEIDQVRSLLVPHEVGDLLGGTNPYYSNGYIEDQTHEQIIVSISGGKQTVIPETGKAGISGLTVTLLDYGDAITEYFASDTTNYLQRRKATIKAGYKGMAFADYLTVFTGWITDIQMTPDLSAYKILITDPQKWMQKYVCRDATGAAPVVYQGNPINILLSILTSTGAGTNGVYDWRAAGEGLNIDDAYVDVTGLETIRDRYYPGDSNYLKIKIADKIKGKELIENEILKVINAYPKIDGFGRYSIVPFKPPITGDTVQSFDEDNIIGLPTFDTNFRSTKNEVEFFYDYDPVDDEYDTEVYYADATSISAIGEGSDQLTIQSKGLHTSLAPSSLSSRTVDILARRKTVSFARWATPPSKISINCWFTQWLSDAGDIVPITHSLLPDLENGTRGLTETRMEVISRTIDWKNGKVKIDLLNTGFGKNTYGVISGTGVVIGSTYKISP